MNRPRQAPFELARFHASATLLPVTSTALAETLLKRVASVGDAKARVAMLRAWLPSLDPDELQQATDEIAARAGLRESPAQVTLLALTEAMADLRALTDVGRGALDPQQGADWGTGRPLTLGERKTLARRPERRLLERALRDAHPDVVAELLVNPRLTELDVARMCAMPDVRPAVLARVFAAPQWAVRGRVRRAIASNPRTPVEIARALVPLLGRAELQEIAADARIDNAVRARALEVLRRLPPTPPTHGGIQ